MLESEEKISELNDENARLILALAKTVEAQSQRESTSIKVGDESSESLSDEIIQLPVIEELIAPTARKSSNVV
jgi:hypothetical protein